MDTKYKTIFLFLFSLLVLRLLIFSIEKTLINSKLFNVRKPIMKRIGEKINKVNSQNNSVLIKLEMREKYLLNKQVTFSSNNKGQTQIKYAKVRFKVKIDSI